VDRTFTSYSYLIIYFIGIVFTIISSLFGYAIFKKIKEFYYKANERFFFVLLCFFALTYTVIFSIMKDQSVLSHHSYFDYAIFLEYFNNFAQGKGLTSSVHETVVPGSSSHWFSNHFTPIIYLFAYTYKILPSFHTVNWLHTILIATSPLILYFLSRRLLGAFGSFCLALMLLFNPTFQYITLYELDFLRFVIPVGILALGFTLGKYSNLYIILSSIAVFLAREDAALLVLGIGAFVFLFQKDRRRLGMFLMAIAIVYAVVALEVVMPLFRNMNISKDLNVPAYWLYEFGAKTPYEFVKNVLLNPEIFFARLFYPLKLFNLVMYLLPFTFLPLFGIDVLVVMLPTLVLLFYSGSVKYASYFLYYVAPILVVMVWATIVGIPRLVRFTSEKERFKKWLRCCPLSIERISFAVLIGSIACSIYFGPSPMSIQFWFKDFSLAPLHSTTFYIDRYRPNSHDNIVRKVAKMIPVEASVSAEFFLFVDIYRNREIRIFPLFEYADYVFDDVEYIFIDKAHPRKKSSAGGPFKANNQFYYKWIENNPDIFELLYSEDGVFLYKRRYNS
jgi:uncharacterized membrane protein